MEQTDTGDVLLFRSNNQIATWFTRTICQSDFDHVGIVLRFGNRADDIWIMESVGDGGVRLHRRGEFPEHPLLVRPGHPEQQEPETPRYICLLYSLGVLVSTKTDLQAMKAITPEEAQQQAEKMGLDFFEVSAARNVDVELPFKCLAEKLVANY